MQFPPILLCLLSGALTRCLGSQLTKREGFFGFTVSSGYLVPLHWPVVCQDTTGANVAGGDRGEGSGRGRKRKKEGRGGEKLGLSTFLKSRLLVT